MLTVLSLLACGGSDPPRQERPTGVPADAVVVTLQGEHVTAGGVAVGTRESLFDRLVDAEYAPLKPAVTGAPGVWVVAPSNAEWLAVRKLIRTATDNGVERVWMSLAGSADAWGPPRTLRGSWNPGCPGGTVEVEGADRAFTFEIHRGGDGVWAQATVRFRPLVGGTAIDALPARCWVGASCDDLDDVARQACQVEGAEGPGRLAIGGAVGCLLPIAKKDGDLAAWPAELATNLRALGITAQDDVMLIPEAVSPWEATIALLAGFGAADQPPPAFGQPLVEGNDGPPMCTAPVRTEADVQAALGRWFAGQIAREREG